VSGWDCRVQEDGAVRLGLRYVKGLREDAGRRIETGRAPFATLDALVAAAGLKQDEIRTLAEIGALASFGGDPSTGSGSRSDRRTALWQAERAGRPAGPLLMDGDGLGQWPTTGGPAADAELEPRAPGQGPLPPMSLPERVRADYDGTGLTIGPHPMALVRQSLASRGVQRAVDLYRARPGRRVRVAGAVITRQRPGTAKGFVFLSLEDETGIANIIVTPDVFAEYKRTIVDDPYLLCEGVLQNQDGAVSVKADRVEALESSGPAVESHDFH
jgi:error-prone DNA polymerase